MRVFKTRSFERWASKASVTDVMLSNTVEQMERGLIDADLGGNLFKQRLALPGRGKSGGARTIVATRFAGMLVFLYGYEKSERDNIAKRELQLYQEIARVLLAMTEDEVAIAIALRKLTEVKHEPID